MSGTNSAALATPSSSAENMAVKVVTKRYEGLLTVRQKAIKGKGAWFWAYLEPVLIRNPETNIPKAVKLKCTLCNAAFSASNPSRTATEHLKKGTCPECSSFLRPVSTLPPLASPSSQVNYQKRSCIANNSKEFSSQLGCPSGDARLGLSEGHLVLSGGKEDLSALAMFEDSVKKLKSRKVSPGPALSKDQADSAFGTLADWLYESCGSVLFSSVEHPKFKAFLDQVGVPSLSRMDFFCARLDSKFEKARLESEARICDAPFFQIVSGGWKTRSSRCPFVMFVINLPNGTIVFQQAMYMGGLVASEFVEETLWEMIRGMCGNDVHRCVGVVADRFYCKALRNLEAQNHLMVNLSCQLQGLISLLKDFIRELPLFKTVINSCLKIANLFNGNSEIRNILCRFRSQEDDFIGYIRVPSPKCDISKNFHPVLAMLNDILSYSQLLHVVIMDDSYKVLCQEDYAAGEVMQIIRDPDFWNDTKAVHSLVKLIKKMAEDIEAERPVVGRCLPLWEELRGKVKDWSVRYGIAEGPIEKLVERRFKKTYHPAWAAAYILDPLYLTRDANGKYLPPFKFLTHEQERDVDMLISRMVSREEAHNTLMELMKWRSEGLEPLYAQAVQLRQKDPSTGKVKSPNSQSRRLVWETCLKHLTSLSKVAVRLLFLQATSWGFKFNWSTTRPACVPGHSPVELERARKLIYVAAHAKLAKQGFSLEEGKHEELLGMSCADGDMLNEVFADAP